MKHKFLLYVALGILALSSCSKDKSDVSASSSEAIQSNLTTGSWKVTNFSLQGQDHTSMVSDFRFAFDKAGAVSATNDLFTEGGSWSLTTHNNLPAIMLNMQSQHNVQGLQEISGDYWDITAQDKNNIEMRRMIHDNPSSDYLTIKRIE